MFGFFKRLFGMKPNSEQGASEAPANQGEPPDGLVITYDEVPIARDRPDLSLDLRIKGIIAEIKGIPLDDVTNETVLGVHAQEIIMNLALSLIITTYGGHDTTVGEVIDQCRRMLARQRA